MQLLYLFEEITRVQYLRQWFIRQLIKQTPTSTMLMKRSDRKKENTYRINEDEAGSVFDGLILPTDPTPNKKFLQWICKLALNDMIAVQEDSRRIKEYLTVFDNMKTHKIPGIDYDINHYKTHQDLFTVVQPYLLREGSGLTNQEVEIINKEAEKIFDSELWEVWTPNTHQASCLLGKGTEWCTADKTMDAYDDYHDNGDLVIMRNKKTGRRYQYYHPTRYGDDTPDFRDERDMEQFDMVGAGFYEEFAFFKFLYELVLSEVREEIDRDLVEFSIRQKHGKPIEADPKIMQYAEKYGVFDGLEYD